MIEIVFPVLNEENALVDSVEKSISFLRENGISFVINIADNGSTDSTPKLAQDLCAKYDCVKYLRVSEKGVGLAFRESILQNATLDDKADSGSKRVQFIGYMDIDLATDLTHLKDVYKKLQAGSKIVVGSRLLADSKVIGRSLKREITSRALNFILKVVLGAKFSDCMCGFKFFRADVAQFLVANASDDKGWFFCAEMLLVAQYSGIQIDEIAVKWSDDANSKVKIFSLSMNYLKRIWFLFKKRLTGSLGAVFLESKGIKNEK